MKIFAIIPARGGSKRLPGKNLRLLEGVSLLERTIRQAKELFQTIVVSSDSVEILTEAVNLGVIGLLRPDRLAEDNSTTASVVDHILQSYSEFEWFCLLQVTSPLRALKDIENCINLAKSTNKPVVSTYNGQSNGSVYIWPTDRFMGDFFTGAVQYSMPIERSLDIDTLDDFKKAEDYLSLKRILK